MEGHHKPPDYSSWFSMAETENQYLRSHWDGLSSRYFYQKKIVKFDIPEGTVVLDIGSGHKPFPHATILSDHYKNASSHRHAKLAIDGRPMVFFDIQAIPFADQSIDFIYCCHVLEHVEDPILACRELMRVGKRGYLETPTFMKDALFSWAAGMHKWFIVEKGSNLCFFEYSEREALGGQNPIWKNLIFSADYHPLQDLFKDNQDIFNVMFSWDKKFGVYVFYNDGSIRTLKETGCD